MSIIRARAHSKLFAFLSDQEGATAMEYALIASGIAIVALVAITAFANSVVAMWNTVATHM